MIGIYSTIFSLFFYMHGEQLLGDNDRGALIPYRKSPASNIREVSKIEEFLKKIVGIQTYYIDR